MKKVMFVVLFAALVSLGYLTWQHLFGSPKEEPSPLKKSSGGEKVIVVERLIAADGSKKEVRHKLAKAEDGVVCLQALAVVKIKE